MNGMIRISLSGQSIPDIYGSIQNYLFSVPCFSFKLHWVGSGLFWNYWFI